jgi:hypothetical protein
LNSSFSLDAKMNHDNQVPISAAVKWSIAIFASLLVPATAAMAQDLGWPRQLTRPTGTLVCYQPQVDDWRSFTELTWRMAFALTPTGGKQVVGVMEMQGHTEIDNDDKVVFISEIKISNTSFPSVDPALATDLDTLVRTFMPTSLSVSLHEIVAYVSKSKEVKSVSVKNDPPAILVSYGPAVLLAVDGAPVLADIPQTEMKFVVNTTWPLFFDPSASSYYLSVGQRWMTANNLTGPWVATTKLPKDMTKVAADPQWAGLKQVIPAPAKPQDVVPGIFYSESPAEIILFDGNPVYSQIPSTQLLYATNTSSYLFLHSGTKQFYYLTGGRWFRASALTGPWSFASADLPADFAAIPSTSPASIILASVPGTDQARDAVLLAQVPTVMTVDPATAAAKISVVYSGEPQFAPITGTSLAYATNTADKIIKLGDVYYLCLQGVWFLGKTPQGPWTVASSVPQVIYTIPPSSPVYNVTYVTQTTVATGSVQSSYTAGYMGAFAVGMSVGVVIAHGSGYHYPPYIYRPPYGYPVYRPYPGTYGAYGAYGTTAFYQPSTGRYGVSQTAVGPYGAANRTASYNPYTGTSARSASVATPYGSRSAGQAYNPYTGTYAATRQGSSPNAQWGNSVVTKGNKAAYTQHYSTSQGTVSSARSSTGGAMARSNTGNGQTTVGRTAGGDLYAGHDGKVYKNTGSGWQTYDNGGWNQANRPTPSAAPQARQPSLQPSAANLAASPAAQPAQRQAPESGANRYGAPSTSNVQGLDRDAQNRQRGAQESSRFQQSGRSGGFGRRGR